MRPAFPGHFRAAEPLERRLLASTTPANININHAAGDQAAMTLAQDVSTAGRLFEAGEMDLRRGLSVAFSVDGGATWVPRQIADGHDNLPVALGAPSAAFDTHGNLFLAYNARHHGQVDVLQSVDGGQTFGWIGHFRNTSGRPAVAAGDDTVWVAFAQHAGISLSSAGIDSTGAVGTFSAPNQPISGTRKALLGDITVGLHGALVVAYERGSGRQIFTAEDPDGRGQTSFSSSVPVTESGLPSGTRLTSAGRRKIGPSVHVDFDRTNSGTAGKLYITFVGPASAGGAGTDVFLSQFDYRDQTWSSPQRVNNDSSAADQFGTDLAVDPVSGDVAIGWYDTRNDTGTGGPGDTDGVANDEVEFFAALLPNTNPPASLQNLQVSAATSSFARWSSRILTEPVTAMAFNNGTLHPVWSDNSGAIVDPSTEISRNFDIYTATIATTDFAGT